MTKLPFTAASPEKLRYFGSHEDELAKLKLKEMGGGVAAATCQGASSSEEEEAAGVEDDDEKKLLQGRSIACRKHGFVCLAIAEVL